MNYLTKQGKILFVESDMEEHCEVVEEGKLEQKRKERDSWAEQGHYVVYQVDMLCMI